jgi:hypothetical protein
VAKKPDIRLSRAHRPLAAAHSRRLDLGDAADDLQLLLVEEAAGFVALGAA